MPRMRQPIWVGRIILCDNPLRFTRKIYVLWTYIDFSVIIPVRTVTYQQIQVAAAKAAPMECPVIVMYSQSWSGIIGAFRSTVLVFVDLCRKRLAFKKWSQKRILKIKSLPMIWKGISYHLSSNWGSIPGTGVSRHIIKCHMARFNGVISTVFQNTAKKHAKHKTWK